MSNDHIHLADGEDQAMLVANQRARATFKFFWRELSWEYRRIIPGLELSAVKMPFENPGARDGQPELEQMWVGDIVFDGRMVKGTLLNDAQWIEGLRAGAEAERPLSEISDWIYAQRGRTYGAFTVQVIRAGMSRSERSAHDSAWGFDFGDPGAVEILPAEHAGAAKASWSLFRRKRAPLAPAEWEGRDHPMCINMVPKMVEALTADPGVVNRPDDQGWTLLQREALAGNGAIVEGLLRHGASRGARTPPGDTALDLATRMGWPHVVALLQTE